MRFVHLPARRHPAPYFGPAVLKLRRASFWVRPGKGAGRQQAGNANRVCSSWQETASLGRSVMCHGHCRGPRMHGIASVLRMRDATVIPT